MHQIELSKIAFAKMRSLDGGAHGYDARIYFEDECPRIGCGWRDVTIKEGHKWAIITERATGRRQRVTIDMLDKLESSAISIYA